MQKGRDAGSRERAVSHRMQVASKARESRPPSHLHTEPVQLTSAVSPVELILNL